MIPDENYLVACGVNPIVAARRAAGFVASASRFSIKSRRAVAAYTGQVLHESNMLSKMVEDLSYSAQRLRVVWPHRFPDDIAANHYAHAPELLANYVYGAPDNKLGNTEPGDGWAYRGSGDIQTTGRANFTALAHGTGGDYIANPDLVRTVPADASLAGGWFWFSHHLSELIESTGDIDQVSLTINPGLKARRPDDLLQLQVRAKLYAKCYALATD